MTAGPGLTLMTGYIPDICQPNLDNCFKCDSTTILQNVIIILTYNSNMSIPLYGEFEAGNDLDDAIHPVLGIVNWKKETAIGRRGLFHFEPLYSTVTLFARFLG
jgi:hypothetical protein